MAHRPLARAASVLSVVLLVGVAISDSITGNGPSKMGRLSGTHGIAYLVTTGVGIIKRSCLQHMTWRRAGSRLPVVLY